ncbi:hypothetical protein [Wolbachia endosymbiont (group A) of Ophion costatus]
MLDTQLYKHSFLKVNCTANDVIPVWDPENLTLNKWLHNKD